jgi:hypothetical protein
MTAELGQEQVGDGKTRRSRRKKTSGGTEDFGKKRAEMGFSSVCRRQLGHDLRGKEGCGELKVVGVDRHERRPHFRAKKATD